MLADNSFAWKEHTRLNESFETEADAAAIIPPLHAQFPHAHFGVTCDEDGVWFLVGDNVPKTTMYAIRRKLRDDDMLNRYSDDADDDRAYWDIPADYQPPPQPASVL